MAAESRIQFYPSANLVRNAREHFPDTLPHGLHPVTNSDKASHLTITQNTALLINIIHCLDAESLNIVCAE